MRPCVCQPVLVLYSSLSLHCFENLVINGNRDTLARNAGHSQRVGDAAPSTLRKIWISLHFEDLFRVPLAVRPHKQQPFVSVQLLANWTVGSMPTQVRRRF